MSSDALPAQARDYQGAPPTAKAHLVVHRDPISRSKHTRNSDDGTYWGHETQLMKAIKRLAYQPRWFYIEL